MKRYLVMALAIALALGIAGSVSAKKMYLINFDKGGMPSDINACEASLSEEKAPKGQVYLKITASAPFYIGEFGPKKANWDGYDVIKFDYFNEGKTPQSLNFIVKPVGSDYTTWMQALLPGPAKVRLK